MDNEEKNWGKPPAAKSADEIRDKVMRDIRNGRRAGKRGRQCGGGYGGLVPGAIILAVGLIFLLDGFGYIRARNFFQFWPLLLVFAGISRIARRDSRPWGVIILLFGIFLQL